MRSTYFGFKRSGFTAAALLFPAALLAQNTGTSHPETLNDVVVTQTEAPAHYSKPSPAVRSEIPATAPTLRTHDYNQPVETVTVTTPAPAVVSVTTPAVMKPEPFVVTDDVNSGVVTEVVWRENEIPEGTLFHVRLSTEISTETTAAGTTFRALLTRPVEHNGRIILPVGTALNGRVTGLHGGHRIGGAAYIHLEPDTITLPDGTMRRVSAQVVDLARPHGTHVNDEGTITGNSSTKGSVAVIGLATGGAAAAGAVIGGGVGAGVGAAIGAGVGTVVWLKHESHQTLPQGTDVVFSLNRPMTL